MLEPEWLAACQRRPTVGLALLLCVPGPVKNSTSIPASLATKVWTKCSEMQCGLQLPGFPMLHSLRELPYYIISILWIGNMVECEVHQAYPDVGSLRSILEFVASGDTVMLTPGIYQGSQNCNIVIKTSDIKIIGLDSPFIDCADASSRHMIIEGTNVEIIGIGFRNGKLPGISNESFGNLSAQDNLLLSSTAYDEIRDSKDNAGCILIAGRDVKIQSSIFINCSAASNGGSIAVISAGGTTLLSNVSISYSKAGLRGGAILVVSSTVKISDSWISSNNALEGGGIYAVGTFVNRAQIVLTNVNISQNSAIESVRRPGDSPDWSGSGGGLVIDGVSSELVISGSSALVGNRALWLGGCILARSGATVTLLDSAIISENRVVFAGGAIAVAGSGTSFRASSKSRMAGNIAQGYWLNQPSNPLYPNQSYAPLPFDVLGYGGAVFVTAGASASLDGEVIVEQNSANLGGGIAVTSMNLVLRLQGLMPVSTYGSTVNVSGSVFFNNNTVLSLSSATSLVGRGCGGGIYGSGLASIIIAKDVRFSNNTAENFGGAIMSEPGSVCDLRRGWNSTLSQGGRLNSVILAGDSTFISNRAQFGGSLHAVSGSVVLMGRATFQSNLATSDGGAIYIQRNASLNISGSVLFRSNSARNNGGCVYGDSSPVMIQERVMFQGNRALANGGALYLVGGLIADVSGDVLFTANRALAGGGIACFAGTLKVWERVIFENNTAGIAGMLPSPAGGAIYANSASVAISGSVRFAFNVASGHGGAVSLVQATLVCSGDVLFDSNAVMDPLVPAIQHQGGGIYAILSTVTVTGRVVFRSNSCQSSYGGGIYLRSGVGAIMFLISGDVLFESNYASLGAAAFYAFGSTGQIRERAVFKGNIGGSFSGGGAIFLNTVDLLVTDDVQFHSNYALNGGAIFVRGSCTVRIGSRTVFNRNWAFRAGAIYSSNQGINPVGNIISIVGSVEFSSNFATFFGSTPGTGGALHVFQGELTISGNTVFRNNSGTTGGAIFAQGGTIVRITGKSVFIRNRASVRGGAVMVLSSPRQGLTVAGSVLFAENTAVFGGAVFINLTQASITCCVKFLQNSAIIDGGGLYSEGSSNIQISDSTFFQNSALRFGGGLISSRSDIVEISSSVFAENTIQNCSRSCGGGAVSVSGASQLRIRNSTDFQQNSAAFGGAVLAIDYATVLIEGANFYDNVASGNGGGMACLNQSSASFSGNVSFHRCSAQQGGALFSNGNSAAVVGGSLLFSGNMAQDGAAIFTFAPFFMQNSSRIDLKENKAELRGGAFFGSGARARLTLDFDVETVFESNSAQQNGGALYLEQGAAVGVLDEVCPASCDPSTRGNGECNPGCLLRACKWDNGDCSSLFSSAGAFSKVACDRSKCLKEQQTDGSLSTGCWSPCFNSSCDWSKELCVNVKTSLRTCPFFDLAVFDSLAKASSPVTTYAHSGGVLGNGRCRNPSENCVAPIKLLSQAVEGIVGPAALDLAANYVYVAPTQRLITYDGNASFELWLKMAEAPPMGQDFYVLSSPNLDLVSSNIPNIGWHLSLRIRGNLGFNCSEAYSWDKVNSWAHVAFVLRPDGIRAYLNGIRYNRTQGLCLASRSTTSFLNGIGFVGSLGLTLGRQSTIIVPGTNNSGFFKSVLVDGLRLWGVDRPPSEISAYMNAPCSDLGTLKPILCFVYRSGATTIIDASPGSSVVGLILPSNSDTCQIFDDTAIGYCSPAKPLLPGRGLGYEPADFASLIGSLGPIAFVNLLTRPSLVDLGGNTIEAFSGCATRPLRFLNNSALRGHGGAVYQSGCDVARDAQGFCFFSGLTQISGAAIAEFQGNYAEGSGGAVFTDCETLATSCAAMMQASLGFPPLRSSSRSPPQYFFAGNKAGGYGDNVATAPSQLIIPVRNGGNLGLGLSRQIALVDAFNVLVQGGRLPNTRLSYIPGQNILDLSLLLLDGLGQIVRGSSLVPLTYVAVSLLCTPGGPPCSYNTALHGPVFTSFNPISGVCETMGVNQSGLQDVVCPLGGTSVLVQVSLFGSASPYLSRTVQMSCLACSAGQSRTEGVANGAISVRSWSCPSCLPSQYVVDPNRHPCRQCPVGATCNGDKAVGKDGSTWELLGDTTRVKSCQKGYILIRDNGNCTSVPGFSSCQSGPELDQCYKCPGSPYPGYFSLRPAFYPGALVSQNVSSVLSNPNMCLSCPRGANCELGGASVVPLAGFWKSPSTVIARRAITGDETAVAGEKVQIYKCLPGACLGGDKCREGQTGFICGVCLPNYTRSGDHCVECQAEDVLYAGRVTGIVLFVVLFMLVWVYISIRPLVLLVRADSVPPPLDCENEDADEISPPPPTPLGVAGSRSASVDKDAFERLGSIARLKNGIVELRNTLKASRSKFAIVTGVVKILFTFFQVTSCFWTAFTVPWPESISDFFKYSAVIKADVFTIPSIACLSRDWDRVGKLLFYTVTPPLLILVLALPIIFARVIYVAHHKSKSEEFRRLEAQFYNCEKGFFFIWTVIATFFFPFGIPLMMLWGLHHFQVPQMAREKTEREALHAMLSKFQDDHKQDLLEEQGVDCTVCSLLFSILDRRYPQPEGIYAAFASKGRIQHWIFTKVLVEEFGKMDLEYESWQLEEDCLGVFEHFDLDGDGQLSQEEFANLTCALCPSRHEDLTSQQIKALIHHRWGVRQPPAAKETALKKRLHVRSIRPASNGGDASRQISLVSEGFRRSSHMLGRMFPAQPLSARDRLLRHCIYLQEEEILAVGKTFWNESDFAPELEKTAINCMGFLFLDYKVQFWYYELIEQLRKLLMTSVIVFFYPGSLNQLAGGILITFIGIILCFRMKPCMQPQLNELQAACLSIQAVTLFYGVILIADNPNETQPAAATAMSAIVLFLNIFVVFIPFIQFFVLRRPPHGNRPIWERVVETAASKVGITTPLGRRASRNAYLSAAGRKDQPSKFRISRISDEQLETMKLESNKEVGSALENSLSFLRQASQRLSGSRRVDGQRTSRTGSARQSPLPTHARRRVAEEERKPDVQASYAGENSPLTLEGQSISASVVLSDFVDAEPGRGHKPAELENSADIETMLDYEGFMSTTMLQNQRSLDPSANSTVNPSFFTGDPIVPHQDLAFYFGTPSTYAYPNL